MTVAGQNPLSYLGVRAPNPPNVILANRNPAAGDVNFDIGTIWVNTVDQEAFILVSVGGGVAVWEPFAGSSGTVNTINNLSPDAGNITLAGTLNEITATSSGSTVTFSLPTSILTPGSLTSTTSLTARTDIIVDEGALILEGDGSHIEVKGGDATDFIGQATLVAGTVTVANTNIADEDRIFVTRSDPSTSTSLGVFSTSITDGVSFTITAHDPSDASTETDDVSIVDYFIVRQGV